MPLFFYGCETLPYHCKEVHEPAAAISFVRASSSGPPEQVYGYWDEVTAVGGPVPIVPVQGQYIIPLNPRQDSMQVLLRKGMQVDTFTLTYTRRENPQWRREWNNGQDDCGFSLQFHDFAYRSSLPVQDSLVLDAGPQYKLAIP